MTFKKIKPSEGKLIKPPHWVPDFNPEQVPPYFSLRYLSKHKHFCLTACGQEAKAAFADRMYELSQLTWSQIHLAPRHGQGYEKIRKEGIKATLPAQVTEDVTIIAFRFYGKAPMAGYRQNATFYILWFDPDFKLYDH
jgi:hypothetical protein